MVADSAVAGEVTVDTEVDMAAVAMDSGMAAVAAIAAAMAITEAGEMVISDNIFHSRCFTHSQSLCVAHFTRNRVTFI